MPQAVLLLWYPVVDRQRIHRLERDAAYSKMRNVHLLEMGVAGADEPGMIASGMVVVNPPWTLADEFARTIPGVSAQLSDDHQARWRHRVLVPE